MIKDNSKLNGLPLYDIGVIASDERKHAGLKIFSMNEDVNYILIVSAREAISQELLEEIGNITASRMATTLGDYAITPPLQLSPHNFKLILTQSKFVDHESFQIETEKGQRSFEVTLLKSPQENKTHA
jgi:hypothetical protein